MVSALNTISFVIVSTTSCSTSSQDGTANMLELLLLFLRVYTVLSLEFSVFLPWALSISYDWMGASRGALLLRLILTNASFLAFSEKSTRLSARRLVLFSIKAPLLPINSMYPTRICLICTNVQFLPLLSPRLCLGCSRLVICRCRRPSGRCCVQYQRDLECTLFSCRPMLKNNIHTVGFSR